jgi:hypothetical protein
MIGFSENLHYLDPGTGSYLMQIILAAGVTASLFFKNLKIAFLNIIVRFRNNKKN